MARHKTKFAARYRQDRTTGKETLRRPASRVTVRASESATRDGAQVSEALPLPERVATVTMTVDTSNGEARRAWRLACEWHGVKATQVDDDNGEGFSTVWRVRGAIGSTVPHPVAQDACNDLAALVREVYTHKCKRTGVKTIRPLVLRVTEGEAIMPRSLERTEDRETGAMERLDMGAEVMPDTSAPWSSKKASVKPNHCANARPEYTTEEEVKNALAAWGDEVRYAYYTSANALLIAGIAALTYALEVS